MMRLFQAVFLLALVPATVYAAMVAAHPSATLVPATEKLTSLSIKSFEGNATRIGNSTTAPTPDPDIPPVAIPSQATPLQTGSGLVPANVSITSRIIRQNEGIILFNVTGTSLRVGSETFMVVNGTGIFNQNSLVVNVHATVTMGSDSGQLILIGRAGSATGNTMVGFASPQSKLAGSFFLSFDAKLTVS